jgi:hypothetical protein
MRSTWLLLALVACGKDDTDVTAEGGPTYYADVRPILDTNCARCHTDGGIAPSFDDAEEVVARASLIQAYTQAGIMPPPAPDPECADYHGSAMYILSDANKQILSDWVDAGAPLGDPADAPAPVEVDTLAPFDVELIGAATYTPDFGSSQDDYRCWAFDLGNADYVYVTGFEAIIDQVHEVHHAVVFWDTTWMADPGDADGFPCGGFGEEGWSYLHGWGPGAPHLQFAEGQGVRLPPNARLVYQSHYFDTGNPTPDNSGYGLLLADAVDEEVEILSMGADSFVIPAGAEDHHESSSFRWPSTWGNFTALGTWPHMHVFGSGFDLHVEHEDGSETCMVEMDDYDFHNQVATMYVDPIEVVPGDRVSITCEYDNSANNPNQPNDPPEDVQWGEGTEDEMCFGFVYGVFR